MLQEVIFPPPSRGAAGGARWGLTLDRSAYSRLRCDGVRPGSGAELAASPLRLSAQTAAPSQFTKRAKRADPGRTPSQPPQRSPPPGTACRAEASLRTCTETPCQCCARSNSAKACAGRVLRIMREAPALKRASCSDSSQLFERSAPQGRAASSATGQRRKTAQGSRCAAPAASWMRRALPAHAFAAREVVLIWHHCWSTNFLGIGSTVPQELAARATEPIRGLARLPRA
jgi:hypothetical protein